MGPRNGLYTPIFFYTGGGRAKRPSHTSQHSVAPAVAAKMVAGAMAATGIKKNIPRTFLYGKPVPVLHPVSGFTFFK